MSVRGCIMELALLFIGVFGVVFDHIPADTALIMVGLSMAVGAVRLHVEAMLDERDKA